VEEIDLNNIISEIITLHNKEIEDKNAVIITEKLPVIHSQKSLITQVFQNLVGNALKYSKEESSVQISISLQEQEKYWQFAVTDNGIGIPQVFFEKIFVIFQRLHNREKYSGTGIGLAITKKIVESLNGKIWVESEENKGSTFYFTIPKK
ncbi:MAG TPA: ATP-binding protein, partial [Chitinophagaceae bacterium]|nr:ATP-binding protein [Chitinophagaceae bacterium]